MKKNFSINWDYVCNFVCVYILELIYLAISTVYLFSLNNLNNKLNELDYKDNPFKVLSYSNNKPVVFFIIMLLLFIVGALLIIRRAKNLTSSYNLEVRDIFISLIFILILVLVMFLLIYFINNPILRAIGIALATVTALLYAFSH